MGTGETTFRPAVEQIGRRLRRRPILCQSENPALRAGCLFWLIHPVPDCNDVCAVCHYWHRNQLAWSVIASARGRARHYPSPNHRSCELAFPFWMRDTTRALDWLSVLITIRRDIRNQIGGYYLAHVEPSVLVSVISVLTLLCSRNLAVVIPC